MSSPGEYLLDCICGPDTGGEPGPGLRETYCRAKVHKPGASTALAPARGTNPKDLVGRRKVALLSVLSSASILHEARAMNHGAHRALKVDGTRGYGPFNWRGNKVLASIYVDAAMRHLLAWFDGEEVADDSGVHHLGHAKACLGILLDAIETGNLVDDRPPKGKAPEILERWREK